MTAIDPAHPETFARRTLLCVTGLSPQIVTETLYALAVKREPHFIPTEVHLITTAQGAEHARLNLLSDAPGWFHRLCSDYGLTGIELTQDRIHVLKGAGGSPLADIRTPADNERAADFVTGIVRELASDPSQALHVSIAGGRKTMGYYLGYALSLYGRAQDHLSHVLVSAPFEAHPDFYYPSPVERVIHTKGDKPLALDCSRAVVELADIPFVRLRDGLDERLLQGAASFSESVAAAQRALGPVELVVDLKGRRIRASGQVIDLSLANLAILAVFARRAIEGRAPVAAPAKDVKDDKWGARLVEELCRIEGTRTQFEDLPEGIRRALKGGMDGDYFSQRLARYHDAISRKLGPAAKHYRIGDGGKRPRRYRLATAGGLVRFGEATQS